jgi:DNA (cytosine-5)-methyltransferase 1
MEKEVAMSTTRCRATAMTQGKRVFIDVFAGCGGLSLGLMQAGWTGLFAVERDINAFQTLYYNLIAPNSRYRFLWPTWLPESPLSVTDILIKYRNELLALRGQVDMLVGGPPCQGFSSAGRRDPRDPRNELVGAFLDFVDIIRPRIVLVENVRGILSDFRSNSEEGEIANYASYFISSLSSNYSVTSRVIDASDFGVPQKRQRYFIVAVLKGFLDISENDPFDLLEHNRLAFLRTKRLISLPVSATSALSDLEVSRNGKFPSNDSPGFEEIGYTGPLTAYQRLMNNGCHDRLSDTRLARHHPHIVDRFERIIDLCHSIGRLNRSLSPAIRTSFGLRKCAIRVLDPDRPSPTVTSMPDDLLHYREPRALTVRENARLQSFPDWFEFRGKYTAGGDRRRKEVPRFTQVANAVPPLVAEALGRTLWSFLNNNIS